MATATTPPAGFTYIFVASFFHKKLGRRLYASDCGKKAFRLKVPIRKK